MKAVVFRGEHDVAVEEVESPQITAPDEALVRVTLSAICGSDLHFYNVVQPLEPGAVLGHEFCGVVEEVGPGVRRFKKGDRVVSSMYSVCGHCYFCRRGWHVQCEQKRMFGGPLIIGSAGGGQAEMALVPRADNTLELIPEGLSDEQAIFVGDILSAAFFGAERAEIRPADSVAVVGAGPVGLLAIQCANLFGPARIFAVDMVESRLELAQELGAIPINGKTSNPEEAIRAHTEGRGADCSIECVGTMPAIETAVNSVRGGGTVSMVGWPNVVNGEFSYMRMFYLGLTVRGGWANVQAYMRPLLELIAGGRLRPEFIISHRMKLAEAAEAYRMFDAREATKVVLTPN